MAEIEKRFNSNNKNTLEYIVGRLLTQQGTTLAVAESCTGGLISHSLTNVPGSSNYFLFAAVTYSNSSKINILGVSQDTIEKYGAVHPITAKEMAEGARKISGATYGLATSGIAGPTGGTKEKPVGTLCLGLATPEGANGMKLNFSDHDRKALKEVFAKAALDQLRLKLLYTLH